MIIFLGGGASNVFGTPTMLGFMDTFDKEVGDNELYKQIKNTFTVVDLDAS